MRQSCLEFAAGRIDSLQHFARENLLAGCSFGALGAPSLRRFLAGGVR